MLATPTANDASKVGGARTRFRRRIRVCHVAYTFYENDNRVIRYAEALAEQGDGVDVIALRRPGHAWREQINGVEIYRIQRREVNERRAWAYLFKIAWFIIKAAIFLTALHMRRRYDVIHVHNIPDFLVFAALVPRMTGARVILDIHDVLPELYAGKFGSQEATNTFKCLLVAERFSCRFAHHVIVANHLWYDKLLRRSASVGHCTAILNYPDLRLFRPLSSGRPADGKFVMLYPGTLNHHQGLDIAVRAFARVHDRMAGAEFHIYGEGPARKSLESLTRDLGLQNKINICDRVPLREVAGVMASAHVGIVPKRADGFGNEAFSTKILEFMACAVPVVVSRTQVDAHYFNDGIVRFFTPGDEGDLALAMVEMFQRRFDSHRVIAAARDFAVAHSWQERVGDYRAIIDSLVTVPVVNEAIAR